MPKGIYQRTENHNKNISLAVSGKNNHMYKKNPGIDALHFWVSKRISKPIFCPRCGLKKKLELTNIAPKYNKKTYTRDLHNWLWLCRKCHMETDKRLEVFRTTKYYIPSRKIDICLLCKETKYIYGKALCSKCYGRVRYYSNRRKEKTSWNEALSQVKRIFLS